MHAAARPFPCPHNAMHGVLTLECSRTHPWQCKEHLVPHMVEAAQIEKDHLKVDAVKNAPPWWNNEHVKKLRPEAPEADGGAPEEMGGGRMGRRRLRRPRRNFCRTRCRASPSRPHLAKSSMAARGRRSGK